MGILRGSAVVPTICFSSVPVASGSYLTPGRDIATTFTFIFFFIGGLMAMLIRAEPLACQPAEPSDRPECAQRGHPRRKPR